ncbi:alpha/beta-hydrolase [Tothia fuscella]|uniref:Alpha/beta-hydrolase n=1 Tax=Tothia fuscella TaxID=1048955 RepID=A0A9P4TTP3_9PEZI|nr:alpha/beta-hydrolase [Tothia fuscella]
MSSKPTLVLVPGAWHRKEVWNRVDSLLEKRGFKCVPVTLPSTTGSASVSFKDDLDAVQEAIKSETNKGRDVVLVAHSYGGHVANSAIQGLARPKHGSEKDTSGYVIGIALIASGFSQTGISFLGGFGDSPPTLWTYDPSGFTVLVGDPADTFYHDLTKEDAKSWVDKLEKQSTEALKNGAEFSYSGWKDVPVWYLETTEDRALPHVVQQMFIQIAKDAGGNVASRRVESSHSPMLSKPKEVVQFLEEAVTAFME